MIVILDTNILISALLTRSTPPDQLYAAWRSELFHMATCEQQLEEIRQVSRRPWFRKRLGPARMGRLVNQLRNLAELFEPLEELQVSPDPKDDFLLSLAQISHADYLVTGDKSGLLALKQHEKTKIVIARRMTELPGINRSQS